MKYIYRFFTALVVSICLISCANLNNSQANWQTLFDSNSNLNQFSQVGEANWRIENGILTADLLKGKNAAFLTTQKTYKDFELYAEVWVDSDTNSGFFVRCDSPSNIGADTCYEFNIWDARPDPTYGTGAIVNTAKVSPMPLAGGRWNTFEISVKGDQLIFKMNGQVTSSAVDKKHAQGGVIGLQYGSGIVKIKKVLIKPI